jgi:hypothetical protein
MRWLPRRPHPRLAPDVEIFLQWLAETPYPWGLGDDGRLRADDHGVVLCAVTAVARHREALAFSVGDWVRAGHRLGLSYASAGLIVDAADGRTRGPRLKMLRARLLLAAGIADASVDGPILPRRRSLRYLRPARRSDHRPVAAIRSGMPERSASEYRISA